MHTNLAHLYPDDEPPYDERDENYTSSEDEFSYYCEVCDREFFSEECLTRHKTEHKVCGIDGCVFSAHPKLVEKHISMQHYTGLYHKIKDLSTPEDIQKWINERKKRYPTKANIEQRDAETSEKKQRGEIINEKQSLTHNQSKLKKEVINRGKKRKNRKRHGQVQDPTASVENKLYRGLLPFAGTMSLPESNSEDEFSLIEDLDENVYVRETDEISDEDETNVIPKCETNNIPLSLSLVADYASDSDEDDGPEEVPIKKIKTDANTQESILSIAKPGTPDDKGNSRFSTDSREKDSTMSENGKKSKCTNMNKYEKGQNKKFQGRSNDDRDKSKYRNRNPKKLQLLNRLLSRSIQHERNLICQCIRYIVDNNYFD